MLARILVWALMLLGGGAWGVWLDLRMFPSWLTSPVFHLVSFAAGLQVLRLTMRASRNTGRWLARKGREGQVPRMETNRLVTDGPYACMRHPMHLGLMLLPVAVALLLGSVSFLVFIAPAEILLIVVLVKALEEPGAVRKFGAAYARYRGETPMFSLEWSCLRRLFSKEW